MTLHSVHVGEAVESKESFVEYIVQHILLMQIKVMAWTLMRHIQPDTTRRGRRPSVQAGRRPHRYKDISKFSVSNGTNRLAITFCIPIFSFVALHTVMSDWEALRNLNMKTYGVGVFKRNFNFLRMSFSWKATQFESSMKTESIFSGQTVELEKFHQKQFCS